MCENRKSSLIILNINGEQFILESDTELTMDKKIVEELSKQFGLKINKRAINLDHPIRAIGSVEVPVKLHKEVTAEIKLNIKEA